MISSYETIKIKDMHIDALRTELSKRTKEHVDFDKKTARAAMKLSLIELERRKKHLKKLAAAKTELIKEFTKRGVVI
jgi:hypothetical protein